MKIRYPRTLFEYQEAYNTLLLHSSEALPILLAKTLGL